MFRCQTKLPKTPSEKQAEMRIATGAVKAVVSNVKNGNGDVQSKWVDAGKSVETIS